ncbi:sensor domain-containing protein [Ectothiorhodospira lacustris]|uniref:sensor domain-containing protein n=2 Tax=Ectothiorhodospira lacustris TaxID=2899127 RepID=UPI001EE8E090|nr:EAL domain-containing protein [Ectothiorhodospira lacustris]MCG5510102.1 EAL domain-containing protein [Ectothiorhodospira lacustris]MCG5521945.1 EAL domain-containing protein [Ectothiorhodospira lacustris]
MKPSPTEGEQEEISALIATLHETGQRLELLTAGEVDSVSDAEGRPFLLLSAQERLRHIEATKQAAVLNALPAHIVLLDAQGVIVSVNEAWRHFGDANAAQCPGYGVGVDYLRVCDQAQGEGSAEASQAAAGIRAVLAGKTKRFSLEYPCHSPTEKRWFLMSATPLTEDGGNGAIVMHIDISERRQAEEDLRVSETRLREMAESIRDVFFLRDKVGGMLYVSPAYAEIWGRSCESLYVDPDSWRDAIHPDDRAATLKKMRSELMEGKIEIEYRIVRPDGSVRWIESRGFPVRDTAGTIVRLAGVSTDITVRKRAELSIQRLNRVNAMLSRINGLIVRVRTRDELFEEACRIAVEAGGFRMAWIGLTDPTSMKLVPAASAGTDDILADAKSCMMLQDDAPGGYGPSAMAVRERKAILVNDVASDVRILDKGAHLQRGIHSLASLPLMINDEVIGVFGLQAPDTGFFDEAEVKLLHQLAEDIAFAIDHIDKQDRLDYLAYYDALTGLANRSLFIERVSQYMKTAAAAGHSLALFLVDLERFKYFNDSLGRPAGDALLRHVAQWLTQSIGDASLLARIGADQFAVVLPEVRNEGDVARLLEKLMAVFQDRSFNLEDDTYRVAARTGVALFPQDGKEAEALFLNAEAALKNAKTRGDRYLFYSHKMTKAMAGKLILENQLRQAIDREEFVLHYQPKVSFASGKLTSAEALIRWNDPRTGQVPPGQFIPVLEETGMIYEAGRWALRKAIANYLRWLDTGLPAVRVAVNVSALQLRSPGFIAELEQALAVDTRAAAGLELEITESLIMADVEHSIATLQAVRAMGVTVAIDDFGTGFSSLSYLMKLPVDTLKIDRSFVLAMTQSPQGLALVTTIINLTHSLKLNAVAEGVETQEQSRLLRLMGCDEMQGYLVSKPLPVEIFETRFLARVSSEQRQR